MDLPKEILLNEVLLKLSPTDILNACIANKSFSKLCNDDHLWFQLLKRDFKNDLHDFVNLNLKLTNGDLYKLLYGLKIVQKFLNQFGNYENLYDLYSLQKLWLGGEELKSIPKELGLLSNLQILDLTNNELKSIPKELGALKSLQVLHLSGNQLSEIPKELGALKSLQILELSYNQSIPKEILDLRPKLTIFKISDTKTQEVESNAESDEEGTEDYSENISRSKGIIYVFPKKK